MCFLCPGSYVINVEASPMLRNVVMNASQQTRSSDAVFDRDSTETIYDTWLLRSPSDFDSYLPRSAVTNWGRENCIQFVTITTSRTDSAESLPTAWRHSSRVAIGIWSCSAPSLFHNKICRPNSFLWCQKCFSMFLIEFLMNVFTALKIRFNHDILC